MAQLLGECFRVYEFGASRVGGGGGSGHWLRVSDRSVVHPQPKFGRFQIKWGKAYSNCVEYPVGFFEELHSSKVCAELFFVMLRKFVVVFVQKTTGSLQFSCAFAIVAT